MPAASQCHTSTLAPPSGAQALVSCETRNVNASSAPCRTEPSEGSERMSERFNFSSTKYGPSVSAGRATQAGIMPLPLVAVEAPVVAVACLVDVEEEPGAQAAIATAAPAPASAS